MSEVDFPGIAARLDALIAAARMGELDEVWPNEDCETVMAIAAPAVAVVARAIGGPKTNLSPIIDFFAATGAALADFVAEMAPEGEFERLDELRQAGLLIASLGEVEITVN